jgi:Ala-tRNA(Pro) deacylase
VFQWIKVVLPRQFALLRLASFLAGGLRQATLREIGIIPHEEGVMSIPQRIHEYLDSQNASFEWLPHPQAFTAQEVAHSLHVSGKRLAKTVMLDADGRLVMAVIPASHRLHLPDLKAALEVKRLEMLPESELAKLFPDCDLGAIPPFGNLYGMEVWVDRAVADAEDIVFTAGTHVDAVRMKYSDYAALAKPLVGRFSELWASKAA